MSLLTGLCWMTGLHECMVQYDMFAVTGFQAPEAWAKDSPDESQTWQSSKNLGNSGALHAL